MPLNNTLEEMDLTDIYRNSHPKEAKYTLFSSVHGTFSKIDHMIGQKASLKNSRKVKSYQAFSLTKGAETGYQRQRKKPKTLKIMETE